MIDQVRRYFFVPFLNQFGVIIIPTLLGFFLNEYSTMIVEQKGGREDEDPILKKWEKGAINDIKNYHSNNGTLAYNSVPANLAQNIEQAVFTLTLKTKPKASNFKFLDKNDQMQRAHYDDIHTGKNEITIDIKPILASISFDTVQKLQEFVGSIGASQKMPTVKGEKTYNWKILEKLKQVLVSKPLDKMRRIIKSKILNGLFQQVSLSLFEFILFNRDSQLRDPSY